MELCGEQDNHRWLWHAIDRATGTVLAYVLGRRQDEVFLDLKGLLEPFGITRFFTDDWGAYARHLDPETHVIGKRHTQRIERKHRTLARASSDWFAKPFAFRNQRRCTISSSASLSTVMSLVSTSEAKDQQS